MLSFNPFTSKTVWGAAMVSGGYLVSPEVFTVAPELVSEIVKVIGFMLATIGIRDAATKPAAPTNPKVEGYTP